MPIARLCHDVNGVPFMIPALLVVIFSGLLQGFEDTVHPSLGQTLPHDANPTTLGARILETLLLAAAVAEKVLPLQMTNVLDNRTRTLSSVSVPIYPVTGILLFGLFGESCLP